MSDTDWSVWSDTQLKTEPIVTQNNDNESHDMSSPIDCLTEYELIKVFTYFSLKERIVLISVCQKWKNMIEKSFKSESVINVSKVGSNTGFSKKAVCLLIRKCCNVRHISLEGMFLFPSQKTTAEEEKTTDNVVVNIVSNCHLLETLDFSALEDFEEEFERNIDYFRRLKKISSKYMTERALNLIIDSQNLEVLDIHRNDNISRPQFIRLGPKIRELVLIESEVIDEVVVKEICCGNGVNITNLSIDIKDRNVLTIICQNLKQLKTFEFNLYSDETDFKHFSNLTQLKTLEIEVMDTCALQPSEFTDLVRSLRNVNLLELKATLPPMNNIAINDESLEELRQNCQSIERLVIRGTNSITGTGMYAIAQMRNIKHLDLKNCLNITDQIEIVITSCPLLRELILHNCSHISVAIVDTIVQKANTLPKEEFYVDVIDTNVTQESVQQLTPPKNLKILYDYNDCIYDCDHGWGPNIDGVGYHSGPEDDDMLYDLDFYDEAEEVDENYDDYDDEDIDYEF